jgi:hypothetical protein
MDQQYLAIICIYLVVLSLLLFLSMKYREKFWDRFRSLLFPIIMAALLFYNLVAFPFINQPYFNWAYRGRLQRLPSNELLDLVETNDTPLKPEWIYTFIANLYQGKTLLIPGSLIDNLDLSLENLLHQGRLAAVKTIEKKGDLTEAEIGSILDMDLVKIPTKKIDDLGNVTKEDGYIYYFIQEEKNPKAPLLLLRNQNQLFFIPEDLLSGLEGGL